MAERICCYEWLASRVEADTAPVRHVCMLPEYHVMTHHHGLEPFGTGTPHRCSCTAEIRHTEAIAHEVYDETRYTPEAREIIERDQPQRH